MKTNYILVKTACTLLAFSLASCQLPKKTNLSTNSMMTTTSHTTEVKTTTSSDVDSETITMTPTTAPSTKKYDTKEITLSFIGDCTIGSDPAFGYDRSFHEVLNENNQNYDYFFKNVKGILGKDDLTIANLETTFTNATKEKVKTFNFKGDPSYVAILPAGSIEIVNLANNHTQDYLNRGYNDTIDTLKKAEVSYYGNKNYLIKEMDNIKIGFAGFNALNGVSNQDIKEALSYFKNNDVDLKIITFHWGIERDNYFNKKQQSLGKNAIDYGADLVVGHHPHVLQGIEKYQDNYIVYSLGNFVFGGNRNPSDKDSMILQMSYTFNKDKVIDKKITIIPVSISSKSYLNDFQPYILKGAEKTRVIKRINTYSQNFHYEP